MQQCGEWSVQHGSNAIPAVRNLYDRTTLKVKKKGNVSQSLKITKEPFQEWDVGFWVCRLLSQSLTWELVHVRGVKWQAEYARLLTAPFSI